MDRETFDRTVLAFKRRLPFIPFTSALENGDLLEVDRGDALLVRDGVAGFLGPGGVPSVFDYRGVTRVIGDLAD
jgi:hypothetical protein